MTPAERWRSELEAWRIPDELLAGVDESPYGWPQRFWKRRSEVASDAPEPHTTKVVRSLVGSEGSVLDVGAGRGRASLPLAVAGCRVTAVEPDPGMAAGLAEEAAALGVAVEVVPERWPEAAEMVEQADVVMSAHVVYDVWDIVPFLEAMIDRAVVGVALELSDRHPWAGLAPYYRILHGLDRPSGPTADLLAEVVASVIGRSPNVDRWTRQGGLYFESIDELREVFGRRLVLPRDRWTELDDLLDVTEVDGRLYVGGEQRDLVTVWWRVS
jgi:SAM-dependent methyltransferase